MYKNGLYIAFVIVLVIGLLFYGDSPDQLLGNKSKAKDTQVYPFAIAHNASTRHFSNDGSLDYEFLSTRLEHYQLSPQQEEDEDKRVYTLIELPVLTIYQGENPWRVEAKKGKLLGDGHAIELWDEVVIRQKSENGAYTQLSTSKLVILPHEKVAQTREPVKIDSPRGQMSGIGMTADLTERTIKLLGKVRGTHDPI